MAAAPALSFRRLPVVLSTLPQERLHWLFPRFYFFTRIVARFSSLSLLWAPSRANFPVAIFVLATLGAHERKF